MNHLRFQLPAVFTAAPSNTNIGAIPFDDDIPMMDAGSSSTYPALLAKDISPIIP
jgi:hypothetical protein